MTVCAVRRLASEKKISRRPAFRSAAAPVRPSSAPIPIALLFLFSSSVAPSEMFVVYVILAQAHQIEREREIAVHVGQNLIYYCVLS